MTTSHVALPKAHCKIIDAPIPTSEKVPVTEPDGKSTAAEFVLTVNPTFAVKNIGTKNPSRKLPVGGNVMVPAPDIFCVTPSCATGMVYGKVPIFVQLNARAELMLTAVLQL